MKNLSLFLAWRYLTGIKEEKNISTMVKVCFIGILISSFSLSLVVAIMNGFEKATHEKMQGIHAQIIIKSQGNILDTGALSKVFEQEFPEIAAWAPNQTEQIIVQNKETEQTHQVMAIKGIVPSQEAQVSTLEQKIVDSGTQEKKLARILHNHHVLLGKSAAQAMNVSAGDELTVLFAPEEQQNKKIALDSTTALVGGIFDTGIDDFDNAVLFANLAFVQTLFPDGGVTQIDLKLKPYADEQTVIQQLRQRFPTLEIYSWKDLYPALVSALKLEKYVSFFILALVTLIASMNIVSLLFMQITQKRGDIAILQALGCSLRRIRSIFLWMGSLVSLIACILGLALSWIACILLERYPFITLPDVYYVTHLPAKMDYTLMLAIFVVIMLLSFLATWIPAQRTKKITISDVLRFEA